MSNELSLLTPLT